MPTVALTLVRYGRPRGSSTSCAGEPASWKPKTIPSQVLPQRCPPHPPARGAARAAFMRASAVQCGWREAPPAGGVCGLTTGLPVAARCSLPGELEKTQGLYEETKKELEDLTADLENL